MNKIQELIKLETKRQRAKIGLIPSENNVSPQVARTMGCACLNSKYSEGYPENPHALGMSGRYYEGNQNIDLIELETQALLKKLFGVPFVNVQPYSGSPANSAIQAAILENGDTLCGISMGSGGHLTHGVAKITFSGRFFNSVQYDAEIDGSFDWDKIIAKTKEVNPKLIIVGTTAYPLILDFKKWREVADTVGAYLVTDISHIAGLVVGGQHPSPVEYADVVMSTTHKTFRGPRGAMILVTKRGLERDKNLPKKIDKAVFPLLQGGDHNHTIAAIGMAAQEAMLPEFKDYAKQIIANNKAIVDRLKKYEIEFTYGGTQNHLAVMNLCPQFGEGYGAIIARALDTAGIYANKNTVLGETSSPAKPSGVRIGSPLCTTRGFKEKDMEEVADIIWDVISYVKKDYWQTYDYDYTFANVKNDQYLISLSKKTKKLAYRFPFFSW